MACGCHTAQMRVHLGSDHAGFELKQHLAEHLGSVGHVVVDHGPTAYDPADDYPAFCLRAAEGVAAERAASQGPTGGNDALGVVIGGSGNGEQIAANKVRGVRCALAWSVETARLARQHNDATVVSIGARMHDIAEATALVDAFLAEPFSADARHARRIAMLTEYEASGVLPPLSGSPHVAGE